MPVAADWALVDIELVSYAAVLLSDTGQGFVGGDTVGVSCLGASACVIAAAW